MDFHGSQEKVPRDGKKCGAFKDLLISLLSSKSAALTSVVLVSCDFKKVFSLSKKYERENDLMKLFSSSKLVSFDNKRLKCPIGF